MDYDAPDPNRTILDYARAAANVTFSNYVVHQVDWITGRDWIYVTRGSLGQVLSSSFQFDYDPLSENLLLHPLEGSLDFTAARGAGLSFWESAAYSALGSLEWDLFAERQDYYPGGWRSKPSINDFWTTATGGVLLGEALYRLSSGILDDQATGGERVLRELGAAAIAPMRGFNRLCTGQAWESGPPPLRTHPVFVALDLGLDQLGTHNMPTSRGFAPTALAAVEVRYGDLLPNRSDGTFAPLEFFEGYGALNVLQSQVSGEQVYGQGLLYGWSTPISSDVEEESDNDVFGFIQNFDYQGANVARYAAMSVGPANYLEWRFHGRLLRLGVDVDWTYLDGTYSPFATFGREYNFSMGASTGIDARLEMGALGNVSLRSRNYVTAVLDGQGQEEVVGFGRLAYDVDVYHHVGLGLSPTFVYRRSESGGITLSGSTLETQLYLRVHD